MKRIKVAVTMLLLALWVPLTSHSLMEQLEWIHQERGHSHSDSGDADHDAADGLCRIESNDCPLTTPHFETALFAVPLDASPGRVGDAECLIFGAGLAPPGAAPAELVQNWQFVFRTALSPRAPSFLL